jgi:hypothetical protein
MALMEETMVDVQADAWMVRRPGGCPSYLAHTQSQAANLAGLGSAIEPLFKAPALTAAEREDLAWAARELSWWRGAATIRRLLERTEAVR